MADHPHLGWDPAPGSPPAIAALRTSLTASATALATAHRLVTRLLTETSSWRGEAAEAFRAALDGDLPRRLDHAHRSLARAARELSRWHDDLLAFQSTARAYDTRARRAQQSLTRARTHEHHLRSTPTTPEADLRTASSAVADALAELEGVRRLARELEGEHEAAAGRVAKGMEEAGVGVEGEEEGVLDKVLTWVDDNLGDALSLLSASLGLFAVFIAAPVAVPLLFAAAGLSLAALVSHASDPEHRAALSGGLRQGRFDGQFWSSAVTLGGDALGTLPGVGAVAHGAKSMVNTTRSGIAADEGASVSLRNGVRAFGTGSSEAMHQINEAPKPVLDWVVRRTSPRVEVPLQAGVAGSAVVTAGVGLTPAEDSDGAKTAATGVDGARIAASDAPSAGLNAARIWAQLTR
ncbi:hypothetical protein [Streptomyces sp. NPDC001985]|uniref:hypothetical protein n=1 Tax=Streptomyces sp. NPDC001985 TaxID=3154406 RepID=UPI00332F19F6